MCILCKLTKYTGKCYYFSFTHFQSKHESQKTGSLSMQDMYESNINTSKEERLWATFCHLGALGIFIAPGIGHIIGPLIFWLIKRQDSSFIDDHGKEALNFQISISIYWLICIILIFTVVLSLVAIPLLVALSIFWLIAIIIAAVRANDGRDYRYPLTIRFL